MEHMKGQSSNFIHPQLNCQPGLF